MSKEIKIILHWISQVFLQKNFYTWILFLLWIFYNSISMWFATIFWSIIGTYTAKKLKYSQNEINDWLYWFNAVLVSIAIVFFFWINIFSIILIILGSFFSAILMKIINKKIPAFTLPFILIIWIIIFITKYFNIISFLDNSLPVLEKVNFFSAVNMWFWQVMFQWNIITWFLFIIWIFISSRILGFYAIFSSIFTVLFSYFMWFWTSEITFWIVAYNWVLVWIAIWNKKIINFILLIFLLILSIYLNFYLSNLSIITLTFPFVLSAWIWVFLKKIYKWEYFKKNTIIKI